MHINYLATILLAALAALSNTSFAAPLTFNIAASITQIGVTSAGNTTLYSSFDFYGKQFSLGDAVYGQVTYGPGSSGSDTNGVEDSILIYSNALKSIELYAPSANFSTEGIDFNSGLIAVSNNSHNTDGLFFQQFGPSSTRATVYFDDESATALSDFSLPLPFNPQRFTYGFADFSVVDTSSGDRLFISARISKTNFLTDIPEPSDYIVFATGFMLLLSSLKMQHRDDC